ncbi:MAG: hypothetical protein MI723_16850 [Caulobacterales bacterium]|nr:hypothetical protein [Caulobacterales bacterium]
MTTRVGLRSLATHLPATVERRADYSYLLDLVPDPEEFPAERRRDRREDAAEQMGAAAAEAALADAGMSPGEVDLVIAQNVGGRFVTPGIGAFIHRALGCDVETPAWNVQQLCAGFVDSCRMAELAIRGAPDAYRNVLIVNVAAWDTGEWGVDHSDPSAAVVGDGAAAGVVSCEGVRLEFLSYHARTHSEIYEDLIVRADGPANAAKLEGRQVRPNRSLMFVRPTFPEWMMATGRHLPMRVLGPALEKAGLAFADVAHIASHQPQWFTLNLWRTTLQEEAGVAPETWREGFQSFGNMAGADAAVNLERLLNGEGVAAGEVVAFFSPGGAGHSPAMILRAA